MEGKTGRADHVRVARKTSRARAAVCACRAAHRRGVAHCRIFGLNSARARRAAMRRFKNAAASGPPPAFGPALGTGTLAQ